MSQSVGTSEHFIGQFREGWQLLREALRGGERDYTEGPMGRAIWLLAIPMVLETCVAWTREFVG